MTILVGEDDGTAYTVGGNSYNANNEYANEFAYVASSSGSAESIFFYYSGNNTASNIRLTLRDSNLLLLASGVATIASLTASAWNSVDISGASESITEGNSYWIGVVADGYVRLMQDTTTYDLWIDSSSTYAAPETTYVNDGTQNKGKFAAYVDGTVSGGSITPQVAHHYRANSR